MAEEKKDSKPEAQESVSETKPEEPVQEKAEEPVQELEKKIKVKKGKKRADINGKCIVKATFNNTIVTITDNRGNVLSWGSAGKVGIKDPFCRSVGRGNCSQSGYGIRSAQA
jgi:hypothetical protein